MYLRTRYCHSINKISSNKSHLMLLPYVTLLIWDTCVSSFLILFSIVTEVLIKSAQVWAPVMILTRGLIMKHFAPRWQSKLIFWWRHTRTSAALVNFLVDLFFFWILKNDKKENETHCKSEHSIVGLFLHNRASYLRMSNKRTELNISTWTFFKWTFPIKLIGSLWN